MVDKAVLLIVKSNLPSTQCPVCGTISNRVHSRYSRSLTDLPWSDVTIRLILQVRRFFCHNDQCRRVTFAERLGQAAASYARRSTRLSEKLYEIGLALGGEAGARLAKKLGLPISSDTLLRLIKKTPLPQHATPRVLGVDDWAWKKGQSYGTILVDLERHQPIELLADREAKTLTAWLVAHPGVEIISRDRAGAYAEASRSGAPQAIQISDRFHLYKNLSETVERVVQRNYSSIKEVLNPTPQSVLNVAEAEGKGETQSALPLKWLDAQKHARFQHRVALHKQVQELAELGYNHSEITEELEISRRRVRVFLKTPPKLKTVVKPSKLDPYKVYLRQRFFEEGCHNATQLFKETQGRGYNGSKTPLINYVTQLRQQLEEPDIQRTGRKPTTQPRPLSDHLYNPRQITRWFMQDSEKLRVSQREKFENLCGNVAELGLTFELVGQFKTVFRERQEKELTAWLDKAEGSGVSEVISFARGIKRDETAVRNSIKLPWSNGPVEGEVNKLKLIKRTMYGRAKFELLRARVLAA